MAITGEHLIELGREMELEKTAIAERERDEANQKLEQALQTIDDLEKSISLLKGKLDELQK